MRMRRKRNLTPRLERCAHLLVPHPQELRGRWQETYPYGELHIELGCGKGRFINETAKLNPSVLFVAFEKYANVLVSALEYTVRENIQNVRYVNAYIESLTEYFAPGEVQKIYINFCDPWPLKRHTKRRLVDSGFLRGYKEILAPNGEICFKTDNAELFDFAIGQLSLCDYNISYITRNLHSEEVTGIMTEYEQKFHSQGMPIYYCRAKI